MTQAMIFDAVRTPRGRVRDGRLQVVTPIDLAATPLAALRARNGLGDDAVADVILGCVVPVGEQGGVITRQAVLRAGFGQDVPGMQINRFCSSGLDAVNLAAAQATGSDDALWIAGGVESMSRVPMGADRGSWVSDPAATFPTRYIPQGVAADLIATIEGHDRSRADAYAAQSHARAAAAQAAGHFDRGVVPVHDINGVVVLDRDDNIRAGTTPETLAGLKPAFVPGKPDAGGYDARALLVHPQVERIDHIHTAGNSSAIVDGAAAVLIGSARAGAAQGLRPRARIRSWAVVGVEPTSMLTGPTPAARRALARAGMTPADIDLYEVNEAFASVALSFQDGLGLDPDRVNVNGGAIALGHPLGATGAILIGTALDELERRGLATALVTLCVAGGMGVATIIERV